MEAVSSEMERLFLPEDLQTRIKKYFEYLWINQKGAVFNGGMSIYHDADLSRQLKHEVSVELVKSVCPLKDVKLLSYFNDDVLAALFLAMKTNVFMQGDYVIVEHDKSQDM